MPTIQVVGSSGFELTATPSPSSAFAKYFKQLPNLSAVQQDLASLRDVPLAAFPLESAKIGLAIPQPAQLASAGSQLVVGAGVSASITVCTKGSLFDLDLYENPIEVPAQAAYLALGLDASISVGPDMSSGNLAFGFAAGTTLRLTNYKLFHTTASTPTFVSALQESLENYVIPAEIDDLAAMGVGDIATVEGAGSLQFSGSVDLLTAANPLASASTEILAGAINVTEGASVTVGASCVITGELQIQIQKVGPGTIRLGVCKKRAADFQVQVTSAIGVAAGMGNADFVSAVLGAISPAPSPSPSEYAQMGLSDEKVDAIAGALKTAVQRRLELSLESELYTGSSHGTAFLYEIDLTRLDTNGRAAVQQALRLNFSALVRSAGSFPSGIREIQSVLTAIRDRGQTLRINLLGIYNYASVNDLTLTGSVLTDAASGEVVITDQANASRIAAGINYLADTDKLRKVMAQNFLITAAYRCSRLAVQAATLKTSYWHFALQAKTDPPTMAENLDVLEELALISDAQKRDSLSGVTDFGRTTLYLNADYDEALTQSLFLGPDGQPRHREEYELIGRNALRLLLHPGEDDYRLRPLADDSIWEQVKDTGGTLVNLHTLFPGLDPDTEIPIIAGDYVLIEWWAATMAKMATSLAAVRRFLSQDPAPSPDSPDFKKVQVDLWHQMADVAKNTHDRFAEPWGFLAMDLASGQQAKLRAQITSPRLALILDRPARPAATGIGTGSA